MKSSKLGSNFREAVFGGTAFFRTLNEVTGINPSHEETNPKAAFVLHHRFREFSQKLFS